jgi:hypothetical protein
MNQAILRVTGDNKNLDIFRENLKTQLQIDSDKEWNKGEKTLLGKVYESSGFNACIADSTTPKELIKELELFFIEFNKNKILISDLSVELSIGVTVGGNKQFIATVDFSHLLLSFISKTGFTLSISAYPTSDNE